jgi:hypothetical protein
MKKISLILICLIIVFQIKAQNILNSESTVDDSSQTDKIKTHEVRKGEKLEDFNLPNINGKSYPVLTSSNKTKLIAFFSSSCGYSIASIGLLESVEIYNQKNDDRLEIITIWVSDTKDRWINSHRAEKDRITWVNLWDEFGNAEKYFQNEIRPRYYVVNQDGVLTDKFRGYNKRTAKKLRKLLLSLKDKQ